MDSQHRHSSADFSTVGSVPSIDISRRMCLKTLAAGSLFAASPAVFADSALAALRDLIVDGSAISTEASEAKNTLAKLDRRISLYNTHTGESVVATFYSNGVYDENALNKLNLFLRDHRENEAMMMDEKLFTQMWAINQLLGAENTFDIISGYRTPKTNEFLRSKSSGVAKFSYHMVGRAIDLRLRDVATTALRDAAQQLNAGGVGYYQSSDFVHIDTAEVRHWG